MRRRFASVALAAIVLAACGGGADPESPDAAQADPPAPPSADATDGTPDDTPGTTVAPAAGDEATAPDDGTADAPTGPPADDTTTGADATSDADADRTTEATSAPDPADPPATDPPTTEPPVVNLVDEGCSTDNSPTATDVADGPRPSIEVQAASAGNQLADVAVRRVNCAGGWVNFKNLVPADRPVLLWMWAPH